MASALPQIAVQVGAEERSLRRALVRGTLRHRRPTPRGLELEPGELEYLRGHWQLLRELTAALRTEPNVRLAVLYGSRARGTEHASSDIDLLVDFRDDASASVAALAERTRTRVGLEVDVARLSRVRRSAPLLLLQAIDEGRPLVDRNDGWSSLTASRATVARAARRQLASARTDAANDLKLLLESPQAPLESEVARR